MNTNNIFQFLTILAQNLTIFPQDSKVYTLSLIVKVICFVTLWSTAVQTLCVKASTIMDANSIFPFLTMFEQNLTILPPKKAMSWPIQLCSTANMFYNAIK